VLWCKTEIGELARYENDPYYRNQVEGPGNPWFVTTLWYARYLIDIAGQLAKKWTCRYAGELPKKDRCGHR
jgi:GH15 family glucan-1,4-alpha-glucosidase